MARPHKGMQPLEPLRLDGDPALDALLEKLSRTSFGARQLGKAYLALLKILQDCDCKLIFTMSGAMTVAKMGCLIGALIERGFIHAVVTTGAIVTTYNCGRPLTRGREAANRTSPKEELSFLCDELG